MAFNLADRVKELSTTTGTGSFALGGSSPGFRTFAAGLTSGDTTWYCAVMGSDFEVGLGTFTAPSTLARTSILDSSNGGAIVSFGAGSKDVFITAPATALEILKSLGSAATKEAGLGAGEVLLLDGSGKFDPSTVPSNLNLPGAPTAATASASTNTTQIATTAMVQAAIAAYIAAQDAMVFKGVINCSANPNYPAADAGNTYRVSVAGKIGGASGTNVDAGDLLICLTDGSASGDQATVGANWGIVQVNIDGAVTLTGTQTLSNKTIAALVTTGTLTTAASATGGAGFNLPHGAAPTSPVNGDFWTTTVGVFARINGVTVTLATSTDLAAKEPLGALAGINTQTSSYTAVLGDAGKVVEMNNASANNFTVPPNSTVAYAINTRIDLVQYGAGQTTIVAGSGVTIRSSGSKLKLTGQYSGASLYKRGTNEWVAVGDLAT